MGEFAQLPALKAVVRDDGTGLGKGVRLDIARHRDTGLPESGRTLVVFDKPRERGSLRQIRGVATRALGRAEVVQKAMDRLGRQGRSRQGHGTETRRLWRQPEHLWNQAAAVEAA